MLFQVEKGYGCAELQEFFGCDCRGCAERFCSTGMVEHQGSGIGPSYKSGETALDASGDMDAPTIIALGSVVFICVCIGIGQFCTPCILDLLQPGGDRLRGRYAAVAPLDLDDFEDDDDQEVAKVHVVIGASIINAKHIFLRSLTCSGRVQVMEMSSCDIAHPDGSDDDVGDDFDGSDPAGGP